MCGRYSFSEDKEELGEWFDVDAIELENIEPSYNVAPSAVMPVVGENEEGRRSILPFRWGLIPFWADEQDISYSMINARADTIDTKRSYKPCFKKYRCLVPASGFYEWKGEEGDKTPYYIHPTRDPMFAMAGIYNVWESPEGERIPTYTIITTNANKKLEEIHGRMPVMLLKEEWDEWLDPGNHDTDSLKELLRPFPEDALDFYRVSQKVNNAENNSRELIEQVE